MDYLARRSRILLAGLAALVFVAAGLAPSRASLAAEPAAEFVPSSVSLTGAAPTATVDVRVTGVHDLGGYEIELVFDPAVVVVERVDRVVGTAEQPSAGREWLSLPDPAASDIGYLQLAPGVITFGAYSFGANNPPGLEGDVTLARLHLRAVGNGSSLLHWNRIVTTDTQGTPQSLSGSDATVSASGIERRLFLPLLAKESR